MEDKAQYTLIQVIIASGKLGSGKNYITENLLLPMLPPVPTLFLAFANHFKVEAIVKQGLDRTKVFGEKDEHTRRALQVQGTELGRDVFGADIWLDLGLEWMYTYLGLGYTRFMFTDARFSNEVDRVQALDGTEVTILGQTYRFQVTSIRAVAPQRSLRRALAEAAKSEHGNVELITGHLSETALDDYRRFTHVVNNDLDQDVLPVIKAIARELTLRATPFNRFIIDVDETICVCGEYYDAVIVLGRTRAVELGARYGVGEAQALALFEQNCATVYANEHHGIFRREGFAETMREAFLATAQQLGVPLLVCAPTGAEIYTAGLGVFDNPYPALPGALAAVEALAGLGAVVLYTHGDRIEQLTKIARLGLSRLPVFVTPDKGRVALAHLMAAYPAVNYIAIGDNFKRDALPAAELGCARTYWITTGRQVEDPALVTAHERGIIEVRSLAEVAAQETERAQVMARETIYAA
jgi:FMN phosphatase YigB (HAD superfamily)